MRAGQAPASARSVFGRFGWWVLAWECTPGSGATAERLGYETIWLGGSPPDLAVARRVLEETSTVRVATGVTNIWNTDATEIAAQCADLESTFPGRFTLGVGLGHRETDTDYRKPYNAITDYLDVLDDHGVPAERRVLAALGPRMLALARDRSLGAHPYLVPPGFDRTAREVLGPQAVLAVEQKVVSNADPVAARAVARDPQAGAGIRTYMGLTNYTSNLRRLGFADEDFQAGGSDRLVDTLVAHGSVDRIRGQLEQHFDVGADHVAIQILSDELNSGHVLAQLAATPPDRGFGGPARRSLPSA